MNHRINQVPESSIQNPFSGLSRLKLFWALSRTPHGLLDMCTPAFGALLWLGHFPPIHIIIIGLITTFAGYTAVYALNDVIDYKVDREKVAAGGFSDLASDLDSVLVRHPMAQGLLSFKEGILWALAWALLALIGAYLLNPVCVLIFICGCALESIYCLLWRVSPFRTFVSGAVKTSGAIAAVFAVDATPSPMYLSFLFLLLFFWEIGGQNIPNDWGDIEEDRRMNAKTIPVRWGLQRSNLIIMLTIMLTLCMSAMIFYFAGARFEFVSVLLALIVGCYLLLFPAIKLHKTKDRDQAMALFNKASYYPLALLVVVVIQLLIP
ncbi:MAG: UbiA family prenyltransferase [Desulfobacterales bacterium]|nr:MAG: UbiA family prenyltransferase [Desulfobacterales bacterium]